MNRIIAIAVLVAASVSAQNLTPQQKEVDFRHIYGLFTTYYAPMDWKKQLLNVDGLDIKPWLAKVAAATTDLEFYDVCAEYAGSFQDTHVNFQIPSVFLAQLGFGVDLYDDKPLIESINRTLLPQRDFPFVIGDEVVSVDGESAESLIAKFSRYYAQGNPRATRRQAAARIGSRSQSRFPLAPMVGETAQVVIRRQNGDQETYTIKWTKTGLPVEVGPTISPKLASVARSKQAAANDYMSELRALQFSGVTGNETELGLLSYGSRNPIFINGLGSGFTRRLGAGAQDFYYSGVFRTDGLSIGYIRIPNYSPPSQPLAILQLDAEIAFFQANTDGLIVDEMRNTGGNLCFGEEVVRRLTPNRFAVTGFQLRAYFARVTGFYFSMINARNAGAAPEVIEQYEKLYAAMLAAYQSNRGVTEPLPLCTSSLERDTIRNAAGVSTAYTKPIMMVTDEFSTSTADSVPAMFQENNLGVLYGYRTNGAGGNNTGFDGGAYGESFVGLTIGVQARRSPVLREGYPYTNILENVGVHPDVVEDYMTKDNLLQSGAPFVQRMLWAMSAYIRQQSGN
ncbi:MAG: S41 family peptidase [Bryobacteraceae bacterium]|nr:S41 family peptidase [Bryobacteraceae bacterium]